MFSQALSQLFIDFFRGTPLMNFISYLIGFLGIVSSIYFYIKSIKKRVPIYAIRTINFVNIKKENINDLVIIFKGEEVQNFSISKIAFWNQGKETINQTDVAKKNPIKLTLNNEYHFLDAQILYQKNPANDFEINISNDKKSLNFNFDYLDQNEGIVIQVFHTAKHDHDISMIGSVKSVESILRKKTSIKRTYNPLIYIYSIIHKNFGYRMMRKVGDMLLIYICAIGIIVNTLILVKEDYPENVSTPSDVLDFRLIVIIVTIIYIYFIVISIRKLYRLNEHDIPEGFDIYDDEFLNNRIRDKPNKEDRLFWNFLKKR